MDKIVIYKNPLSSPNRKLNSILHFLSLYRSLHLSFSTINTIIAITIIMLYRTFTVFVVATLLLVQLGSAATGDLVISGVHHRKPHGCFKVLSNPALIKNDNTVVATGYSEADCQGTPTSIPAGHDGLISNLKSIYIE
jgi:hypothetical protein